MARYAVILAGGTGTRLWPLSRRAQPKQVRALLDHETLLQKTYQRIRTTFAAHTVFVSTLAEHADEVRHQLPEVMRDHVITEPIARDTAAAIGYAALHLRAQDPEAMFVTINSDAYVADEVAYHASIAAAFRAVEDAVIDGSLVGIRPMYAETGYGYIAVSSRSDICDGVPIAVEEFVEKPDAMTATQFVASGRHLWNPALFVFRAQKLLEHFARLLPSHAAALDRIAGSTDIATITQAFLSMPAISIDYGIMEKLERLMVIPASFRWADVGHWRAVHAILADEQSPQSDVARATHVGIKGDGNLVVAPPGKLIATYGIANCVIIDTADALLICPRDRAQEVKEIVREVERRGLTEYL